MKKNTHSEAKTVPMRIKLVVNIVNRIVLK
jgi:hypothetical protein